jgi:CTP:molybdopterin cytidylyltransferase MocA
VERLVAITRTELVEGLRLPTDPRIRIAINDDADSEMIDSIRIGLSLLREAQPDPDDGVLVVPSDMPTLSARTCRLCIDAFRSDPARIVVATHQGKRGHPIVFPYAKRGTIDTLNEGLRGLLDVFAEQVTPVPVEDPGARLDVDTPEEYDRLSNANEKAPSAMARPEIDDKEDNREAGQKCEPEPGEPR